VSAIREWGAGTRARHRSRPFFVIALVAATSFVIAVRFGSFIAGGSDSYCYLSEARLWAQGWPVVQEPLITQTDGTLGRWTFVPLGYKPGLTTGTFVPICPIGYPVTMALFLRLFGPGAEMYLVPLAAAGLVFLTGWLGHRVGGEKAGVLGSALLATSPIFVLQSVQPMSDIPAAFFWLLSAALVMTRRTWAGAAVVPIVALAVLTRPNLAPLGLPLAAFGLLVNRRGVSQYNWMAAGVVAGLACGAAIAAYTNTVLYGAPQSTGYGDPANLYSLRFLWPNLERYSAWLWRTESYLILLATAGIARLALGDAFERLWAWYAAAVIAIVLLSYLFYTPFGDWTYLRFLLPALPLIFIAYTCVAKRPVVAVGLSVALLAVHIYFNWTVGVLATHVGERRYLEVSRYINEMLPENAVFIAQQHSGSVRYYTGRKTLRFDWLPPRELDNAVSQMTSLGYKPYILLDDWEEPIFKTRFARSALARLDWWPTAEFATQIRVRIYDPAAR
jgi:dolichyl-phosphate-mannose-protein mannosyltransferase